MGTTPFARAGAADAMGCGVRARMNITATPARIARPTTPPTTPPTIAGVLLLLPLPAAGGTGTVVSTFAATSGAATEALCTCTGKPVTVVRSFTRAERPALPLSELLSKAAAMTAPTLDAAASCDDTAATAFGSPCARAVTGTDTSTSELMLTLPAACSRRPPEELVDRAGGQAPAFPGAFLLTRNTAPVVPLVIRVIDTEDRGTFVVLAM